MRVSSRAVIIKDGKLLTMFRRRIKDGKTIEYYVIPGGGQDKGETLEQNEVFGSVEAVKTVSDLNMPVAGEVLAINEAINDQPELVNNDPYGEGWMIKISVANPDELDTLLDAEGYQAFIG